MPCEKRISASINQPTISRQSIAIDIRTIRPFFIIIAVLFSLTTIGIANAATLYVPENYQTISSAINAASPGDSIVVHPGIYNENIVINKKLSLIGEGLPAIDAKKEGEVITITADTVALKGFKVITKFQDYALLLVKSNNNVIENNTFFNTSLGIILFKSINVSITNNRITDIRQNKRIVIGDGILLQDSSAKITNNFFKDNLVSIHLNNSVGNEISNNNIKASEAGILFHNSSGNKILYNEFVGCGISVEIGPMIKTDNVNVVDGNTVNLKPLVYLENKRDMVITGAGQVILVNSQGITITNNDISRSTVGIQLWNSSDNTIKDNKLVKNNRGGISLSYSPNNDILNNTVIEHDDGIHLAYSQNNKIFNNTVSNQRLFGLSLLSSTNNVISRNVIQDNRIGMTLRDSSNNLIYLNDFVNNSPVFSSNSQNSWKSINPITYVYNLKTFTSKMGNYWSDQSFPDTDNNGIGDVAYKIRVAPNNWDYYPRIRSLDYYSFSIPSKDSYPTR